MLKKKKRKKGRKSRRTSSPIFCLLQEVLKVLTALLEVYFKICFWIQISVYCL